MYNSKHTKKHRILITTNGRKHRRRHTMQRHARQSTNVVVCVSEHILHVSTHISKGKETPAIRGAERNREAPLRASLLILGASGCPQGDQGAPALHSLAPDTNQTQQHKHKWGRGWDCVRAYERDRDPEIDIKRGKLTEAEKRGRCKRTSWTHPALNHNSEYLMTFFCCFFVFFSSTSQPLPCEESNYMSRTSPH